MDSVGSGKIRVSGSCEGKIAPSVSANSSGISASASSTEWLYYMSFRLGTL